MSSQEEENNEKEFQNILKRKNKEAHYSKTKRNSKRSNCEDTPNPSSTNKSPTT